MSGVAKEKGKAKHRSPRPEIRILLLPSQGKSIPPAHCHLKTVLPTAVSEGFQTESSQCATFVLMENKQDLAPINNTSQPYNALELYNTSGSLSQYIIYNLFRILRPIRKKFKLTINEIIILNGMMLYNRYLGSSFSYTAILRFVGYFNDKKMRYYFGSLQEKGCIIL